MINLRKLSKINSYPYKTLFFGIAAYSITYIAVPNLVTNFNLTNKLIILVVPGILALLYYYFSKNNLRFYRDKVVFGSFLFMFFWIGMTISHVKTNDTILVLSVITFFTLVMPQPDYY